jgi:hypothetical protein
LIVRECLGQKWGIACIPGPAPGSGPIGHEALEPVTRLMHDASAVLEGADCEMRILLAAGQPAAFYTSLGQENALLFDVVIGAPLPFGADIGLNEMPSNGPLVLPELERAGRQLGICHFIYSTAGTAPTQYNFMLRDIVDNGSPREPYRKQAEALLRQHEAAGK